MEKKYNPQDLKKLFFSNLYISACTFGGGMVIVTFMKKKLVDELHYIEEDEMLDLIAIAQSTPGIIAVNTSILVGWRIGGFLGMIVSVLATILPPMTILLIISHFYEVLIDNKYIALMLKGMQAGVAAVLMDVVIKLLLNVFKLKNPLHFAVLPIAFVCSFVLKINVVFIILGGILVGVVAEFIKMKRKENAK